MIPIIINNFNRLTTTKKLVEDLKRLGYEDITILDNNSSYPPLLEWYNTNPCKIYRFNQNFGPRALWDSGIIELYKDSEWIAYTDSDIELNDELLKELDSDRPNKLIQNLIQIANFFKVDKVGLALKIDDLPDNDYANYYKNWESQFWKYEINKDIYKADIDTTFALIKPNLPFQYHGLRISGLFFEAKHIPWYTDFDNLTEEEKYYLEHANNTSTYKTFYTNYIKNKKPNNE